jgi:LmbE family N-acetylglucosaminyl deacetylase
VGGLALRLQREARMEVINVAVTQGGNRSRQAERFRELEQACAHLGFGLVATGPHGLEKVTAKTRENGKVVWAKAVAIIAGIILQAKPRVIFAPHEKDRHETHIGTHFLVFDALKSLPAEFACFVVETEYWGAMETPNLMVESSVADVADLVTALSFHAGEVRRNPFHLALPAWLQDNVRRGSELVGGQGATAPDFTFATLYRIDRWNQGRLEKIFNMGKQLACSNNPLELFD